MRLAILKCFSFIPDKSMIKLQYRIKLHRKLDLVNPRRFTEKLQWYKIYYRDLLMQQCVDKYEVRKYVEECGLSEILIPIVGVYDDVRDIKIEELPEQFVAKDTLGGGGNSVIICNNKENLKERYGLENIDFEDFTDAYEVIGRKRGCILRGNEVDYDKVSALIVRDLNEGHLGKVTFDE